MHTWRGLAVAVPTFKRNDMLVELLVSIERQSVRPALVLVVDNNPGGDARQVVEDFSTRGSLRVSYLPLGRNTGPAGAFASALAALHSRPDIEWMMCRGDDNPFRDADTIAAMMALSQQTEDRSPSGLGVFGMRRK